MSLGRKAFDAPARLWMNWPLWGGMLATVLLARHTWILFAPSERAVPAAAVATQSAQASQLFGVVSAAAPSASLSIRPIGIFASRNAGFAVLQTESGQVGVGVGSQIVPGVRLVETHPDYVVLERNGVRQRADLVKAPAAGGGITPPLRDGGPNRADPALAAQARLIDQLTPEQRTILQQQQQLLRGRP